MVNGSLWLALKYISSSFSTANGPRCSYSSFPEAGRYQEMFKVNDAQLCILCLCATLYKENLKLQQDCHGIVFVSSLCPFHLALPEENAKLSSNQSSEFNPESLSCETSTLRSTVLPLSIFLI